MKIIDRATRGMAARFFWGGLVVVFLIGLFLARGQKVTGLNDQVQQAQSRVESYAKTTIADQALVDTRADTITFDKKDFAVAVEGDIFTDPTVARVRVWDKDGVLLASSDPNEVVGELKVTKDQNFTSALTNKLTQSHVVQENFTFATVGSPAVPTNLLEVTTPFIVKNQIEPAGVVQMDVYYSKLQTAAESPWDAISRVCIIGALIAGILFVIAMVRKPVAAVVVGELEAVQSEAVQSEAVQSEDAVEWVPWMVAAESSRDQELEEELKVAREQLRQASEAFAFLEARVKDGPSGQASSADIEAATGRIAELEVALKRAEEEAAAALNGPVSQEELDRVKRDADERIAEMERQMQEDAAKVDPEMEALRGQLADAEARAKGAEDALASARADVAAAREEVETAPPPNGQVSNEVLEELEAKVADAEARAKEAEEEALRLTPEANDLRARLAQAAARKKLGPSG
ncbi:MAG TPA: hypothetical protein VGQ50_05760 [Actinomycetota bacterium]|jgi:hypothetical protein|nr:hypothetical protein [Actinomycetota bacterium]